LRVIEASRKAGKVLYMGFNMRHNAVVRKMRALIEAKTLGNVFSIQAIEHYDGGRTYMARWNRLKKYSGSLFIHKGSHDFDVVNWFMGAARPVKVSCFANVSVLNEKGLPFPVKKGVKPGPTCSVCKYRSQCPDKYSPADASEDWHAETKKAWLGMWNSQTAALDHYNKDLCIYLSDKDTHDQGIAIVEYDNGATASHSEYFATPITNRRYLVEGSGGHGEADLHAHSIEIVPRWSKDKVTHVIGREAGGHGGADPHMCAEFIECIQKGRRPTASGIDGAWSVAVGQAAELSRTESRVVKISEVLDVKSSLLKPAR
jgi:predicted dehydrogenase